MKATPEQIKQFWREWRKPTLERQELRNGMIRLENAVESLVDVQEGVANLLASLDDDRPTIFRKLTII